MVDVADNPRNAEEKVMILNYETKYNPMLTCHTDTFKRLNCGAYRAKITVSCDEWKNNSMTFTQEVSELGSIIAESWDNEVTYALVSKKMQESIEVIRGLEEIYTHISPELYDKICTEGVKHLKRALSKDRPELHTALNAVFSGLRKAIDSGYERVSGDAQG